MPPLYRTLTVAEVGGLLLLLGLSVAGCVSSQSSSVETTNQSLDDVTARLRSAAERWRGAPHEWGGSSRQGVDCSGLVQSVYATQFDVSLPRTTEEQVDVGRKVRRSSLQPADLVFFRHERKKYHVGIYLSNGDFLHASASSGGTVSPLDRSYWTDRWWQARRILSASADSSGSSSSPDWNSSSSGVGW